MSERKDITIKVKPLGLKFSMPSVTLRLKRRSKEKVAGSNKSIFEVIERVNNRS